MMIVAMLLILRVMTFLDLELCVCVFWLTSFS